MDKDKGLKGIRQSSMRVMSDRLQLLDGVGEEIRLWTVDDQLSQAQKRSYRVSDPRVHYALPAGWTNSPECDCWTGRRF